MKVKNLMWTADKCPLLSPDNTLQEAILLMTKNNLGGCAIMSGAHFKGILVEGDIRRAFTKNFNLRPLVLTTLYILVLLFVPFIIPVTILGIMDYKNNLRNKIKSRR